MASININLFSSNNLINLFSFNSLSLWNMMIVLVLGGSDREGGNSSEVKADLKNVKEIYSMNDYGDQKLQKDQNK